MIARCIHFDDMLGRATVVLEPNWLDWLRGSRTRSVDLEYVVRATCDGFRDWRTVATRRWLDEIDRRTRELIRYALDFREVGSPARWKRIATVSGEAWAP